MGKSLKNGQITYDRILCIIHLKAFIFNNILNSHYVL